jgi:hypothetical protein
MKIPKYLANLTQDKIQMISIVSFLALGLGILLFEYGSLKNSKIENTQTIQESPDTIIPKGYVLVPIELANSEALGSMIDEFAIVDLYAVAMPGEKHGSRVGQKLRLIRAPLNPKTFAVLVPEAEATKIVSSPGPVVAVIQNKNQKGLGSLEKKTKQNHIQYYN